MIRKLYLMNDLGLIYYFDYRTSTLITALDGLGFDKELGYLKYDNSYECIERNFPLGQIQANLIFLNGYSGYSNFLEFLKDSKDLKLYYVSDTTKYCNVEIKSLSKSELVAGSVQSTIVLDKLTLWLKETRYEIKVNTNSLGKVYPYIYPHTYSSSFKGKIRLKNNGAVVAPLNVEIYGEVNDPEVNIVKDGIIISSLKLYVTSSDSIIKVSSNVIDQYIKMIQDGEEYNIYQNQDFNCDNFLFLNPGEYEIEFNPGVSSQTVCVVTITEGYLG